MKHSKNKMNDKTKKMDSGIKAFSNRLKRQISIYSKIVGLANKEKSKGSVFYITNSNIFNKVLKNFGPAISQETAKSKLSNLYEMGVHKETGALIISNKGATLYCLSPKKQSPYLARH